MLRKILTTVLLTCTVTTFAGTTKTIPFTSNKTPIKTEQNKTFDILLQSNPTTGYSWKWDATKYAKNLVTLVSHKYVTPENKKLVGAPGYEVWEFKAKAGNYRVVQVGHIVMEYARPWEKTPGMKKTFIIHIK
ncbi:MAG: protease inhibitor I42 family protein [Gammaproteobacteria bacterium]|nr:protease inhibitor I42 family protein [Gammaproteobacteria bacterium]